MVETDRAGETVDPYRSPETFEADVPIGDDQTPEYRYDPARGLRMAAQAFLLIKIAGHSIYLLAALWYYVLRPVPDDAVDALAGVVAKQQLEVIGGFSALGLLPFQIAGFILLIVWLRRAYANTYAFGAVGQRITPGWMIGWWFIPFANLVKPFQGVVDIWRFSLARTDDAEDALRTPAIVGFWWAAWLISSVVGNVTVRIESVGLLATSEFLEIVYALLAFKLLSKLAGRQETAAKELGL